MLSMTAKRIAGLQHDVRNQGDGDKTEQLRQFEIVSHDSTDIPPSPPKLAVTPKPKKSPPRECVFATLASGGSFTQMKRFCANMDIDYIAKRCFYCVQAEGHYKL